MFAPVTMMVSPAKVVGIIGRVLRWERMKSRKDAISVLAEGIFPSLASEWLPGC